MIDQKKRKDLSYFTLPSVEAEKNSVPDFDCNQTVL